ncbi:hypothetical protein X801_02422, partial [Opisthorchis viverrini]
MTSNHLLPHEANAGIPSHCDLKEWFIRRWKQVDFYSLDLDMKKEHVTFINDNPFSVDLFCQADARRFGLVHTSVLFGYFSKKEDTGINKHLVGFGNCRLLSPELPWLLPWKLKSAVSDLAFGKRRIKSKAVPTPNPN